VKLWDRDWPRAVAGPFRSAGVRWVRLVAGCARSSRRARRTDGKLSSPLRKRPAPRPPRTPVGRAVPRHSRSSSP